MKIKNRNNKTQNRFSMLLPILTIVGIGFISVFFIYYKPSWNFGWNDIRKDIKDSIELAKDRGITSGVGGMGSSTEYEIKTRMWIMKNATESELLKLTEYPNGTVKAIAYEGLLRNKGFNSKTELIIRAIKDTTYLFNYQSGCLGTNIKIGDYLIQNILMIDDEMPPPPPEMIVKIGLTELDKKIILTEYRKQRKVTLYNTITNNSYN